MSKHNKQTTQPIIAALMQSRSYDHDVDNIELRETHISWILLTGHYAYKIKKPVNLGFLDFSSIAKRRQYCLEEIRLNRRLAPEYYLNVVPITGTVQTPHVNGIGNAIEYAVKMRQFPLHAELTHKLKQHSFNPNFCSQLAQKVAQFHDNVEIARADQPFGDTTTVDLPALDNFNHLSTQLTDPNDLKLLHHIEAWTVHFISKHRDLFTERKKQGFIRECHGDLHLNNIAWVDEAPLIFDCIEFNEHLRWIDVISEVAFLVMDFQEQGYPQLANHFLNTYLEETGDYAGVAVLPFYLVYRAMVRCKVEHIRLTQIKNHTSKDDNNAYKRYLNLAQRYTLPRNTSMIITHGLSGSGKTSVTTKLAEQMGTFRLRSDVERKRQYDLTASQQSYSTLNNGIYSNTASQQTYTHLLELANHILDAGFPVIIDATFLKQDQRKRAQHAAANRGVPFIILTFEAPLPLLRQWIKARSDQGTDASEANLAVLDFQLSHQEILTPQERRHSLTITTSDPINIDALVKQIATVTQLK